jgi:hypothetical protein
VRPAIGELNVPAYAVGSDQPVVSGIAIHLQNAFESLQYMFGVHASVTARIADGHAWWSAVPWAIIPRQRLEVAGFGFTRSGIENWGTDLANEQLSRALQLSVQRIKDGTQFIGGGSETGGSTITATNSTASSPVLAGAACPAAPSPARWKGCCSQSIVLRNFINRRAGPQTFRNNLRLDLIRPMSLNLTSSLPGCEKLPLFIHEKSITDRTKNGKVGGVKHRLHPIRKENIK